MKIITRRHFSGMLASVAVLPNATLSFPTRVDIRTYEVCTRTKWLPKVHDRVTWLNKFREELTYSHMSNDLLLRAQRIMALMRERNMAVSPLDYRIEASHYFDDYRQLIFYVDVYNSADAKALLAI